jgi:hypothetical protein
MHVLARIGFPDEGAVLESLPLLLAAFSQVNSYVAGLITKITL